MKSDTLNMAAIIETEKITVELTKEQKAFLDWAAKLEGVDSPRIYAESRKGKAGKNNPRRQLEDQKKQPWGLIWIPV